MKLEKLFLKAGQTHYYQYIITILFTLEFCCTHFLNYCLPYLERGPEVYIISTKEREPFYYDLCNNETAYSILVNDSSIVNEFNIKCNKTKIYFLGICYYAGKIIGSCISYLFIDRIGRKITIFIFAPISILLMCAFKFMKAKYTHNWIYGIYVDLFLSGASNYIIVVTLLIYMCEIVQQTKIPYFIMTVATGAAIAGLLCSITFHVDDVLDWSDILLIFAGIHFVVYILLLFLFIDSPMFALNEEHFEDFSIYLRQVASRNGKNLTQEDFLFLAPYMPKETRKRMFEKQGQGQSDINLTSSSSNTESDTSQNNINEEINKNLNYIHNINNINNETANNLKVNNTENTNIKQNINLNHNLNTNLNTNMNTNNNINEEPDVTYVSVNNMIFSDNKLVYPHPGNKRRDSIFVRNAGMKDIYLLSLGEDADVPVKSLFGDLDLLRFQSQIKHFLTLTFIWIVTVIIRTGIDFRKKYIRNYIGKLQYPIINFGLDICLPFILLVIYHHFQYSIQKILVSANLVQFIFFVLVGFFIQKIHENSQIVFLMLGKVCCHVVYLVMYVITSEIYPIMIRTKGVGFNIGFSGIGTIISIFLIENLEFDSLILYFLLFNFFSIVICYGLPNKIGTLLLDNPKSIKEEEEDDVKLGDICIENAILVKSEKPEKSGSLHRTKTKKQK